MGKAIERIALERGHRIAGIITTANANDAQAILANSDAAIEFTRPEVSVNNIKTCFNAKVPVVIGTTGWYAQYDEIAGLCRQTGGAMLAATNFSLGVNIFFKLNEWLANVMNKQTGYQPYLEEIHHTQKLDHPSGTALTLAEGVLRHTPSLQGWTGFLNEQPHPVSDSKLPVFALREEHVPGTHRMVYTSAIDDIEIKHTAHSRDGFALGAVIAAEYISGKSGVFTMNDVLNL